MRKIFVLLLTLFSVYGVYAQGIEFKDISFNEAKKLSKKENKAIFVDLHTVWCGPCKTMEKSVFTMPKVGAFYNDNFICLKYDAEKEADGVMLSKYFDVTAYPTMLFLNYKGELVYRMVGGRDPVKFVSEAENALISFEGGKALKKMDKRYAKNLDNVEFLNEYYRLRNAAGLDCGDILQNLFSSYTDEDLVKMENIEKIDKLTIYNKEITDKIMTALVAAKGSMDSKMFGIFNRAVPVYLSAALRDVVKDDNLDKFNEIMEFRKIYMSIDGNVSSVTGASMGGGTIKLPETLIRLDYYSSKGRDSEFMALMDSAVDAHLVDGAKKYGELKAMIDAGREKANESEDKEKAMAQFKQMEGMMSLFMGADIYYASMGYINYIQKYEMLYSGVKDNAFNQRLIDWYYGIATVLPSPKVANSVYPILVDKGELSLALSAVELGLREGTSSFGTEAGDVERSREILGE